MPVVEKISMYEAMKWNKIRTSNPESPSLVSTAYFWVDLVNQSHCNVVQELLSYVIPLLPYGGKICAGFITAGRIW